MADRTLIHNRILTYQTVFDAFPPEDRCELISAISKSALIKIIAGTNYRLKPKDVIRVDESVELQYELLGRFIQVPESYDRVVTVFNQYVLSEIEYGRVFIRESCLYAMEEIINSPDFDDKGTDGSSAQELFDILRYLLAVNQEIYKNANVPIEVTEFNNEELNPKTLALSESNVQINPILVAARGFLLCAHLQFNSPYGEQFKHYVRDTYKLSPFQMVFVIYEMYCINHSGDPNLDYLYRVDPSIYGERFDSLSKRVRNEDTIKILNIKKNPFYKIDDFTYVLLDNSLLILKAYTQLMNDFWFDSLKDSTLTSKKQKDKYKSFMGEFGLFFEKVVDHSIKSSFAQYDGVTLLTFDQLKDPSKGCPEEIADLYLRQGNKIILGQVKGGKIYDAEKYKGSLEGLYRQNRDSFFQGFGVRQIIDSLKKLDRFIPIFDDQYDLQGQISIFPCIIVDDFALQTPLMADVFNKVFFELLSKENFERFFINPLSIIHISDLEKMEYTLRRDPEQIWRFMSLNFEDSRFIPPFYSTVDGYLRDNLIPERVFRIINHFKQLYLAS
ncbi:hypothetical protein [Dyadobacter sp. OTU695]|uniref:hypothetical protein n=1 Tax=Dyadobacter sp. OTU695 TaxID=3043860 RepID=UPI00313A871C